MLALALALVGCATTPSGPSAEALLERGETAFRAERYASALPDLMQAARLGNARAQYAIGYMYYNGLSVSEDMDTALVWIRRAARNGNPEAVEALARIAGSRGTDANTQTESDAVAPESAAPPTPGEQPATATPAPSSRPAANTEGENARTPDDSARTASSSKSATGVPKASDAPSTDRPYAVQAGFFSSRDNAEGLRDRLAAAGMEADVEQVVADSGTVRYRVIAGRFANQAEAESRLRRLREEQGIVGFVLNP